jgi:hypothetical protein
MDRGCWFACAALAVVAVVAASSSGVASSLLSTEEMSRLRGAHQKYCRDLRCGPLAQSCTQNESGGCDPTIPSIACDNNEWRNVTVKSCYSLNANDYPCTQPADPTNCGTNAYRAPCNCNASHVCKIGAKTSDYSYYRCP